jgi:protein-disulfide isomerase
MMKIFVRPVALAALVVGVFYGTTSFAQSASTLQKDDVEKIIRSYLLENPEIIVEAYDLYQKKMEENRVSQQKDALIKEKTAIFDNSKTPVMGNPDGDVTLVEFFDYQCGYCKSVHNDLMNTVKSDGKVKLIMKQFPILGPMSTTAAKAAYAASLQNKFEPLHEAMMTHRGALSEEGIYDYAEKAGLDVAKLKTDMESETVKGYIEANLELGQKLQIRGTPAFIIGNQIVPGAIPADEMKNLINKARQPG